MPYGGLTIPALPLQSRPVLKRSPCPSLPSPRLRRGARRGDG